MTLFGLSGLFTWSFVRKTIDARETADIGISVFAYAVKSFLCLLCILLLAIPATFCFAAIVVFASDGSFRFGDGLWNHQKAVSYMTGYLVTSLWLIPAVVLTCSAVITWSVDPFKRFVRAFTGKRSETTPTPRSWHSRQERR